MIDLSEFEIIKPSNRNSHNREIILENNLLKHLTHTRITPKNKKIICEYVKGKTYKQLSQKYNVTENSISILIHKYIKRFYQPNINYYENK